ncbi:MAG: PspC domain-containing protein [Bryobacteraceae bacterium]
MFCTQCGVQLEDADKYCAQCAAPTPNARAERTQQSYQNQPKPLRRSMKDKKLGGVCSGVAEFAHVDIVLVRVLVVAASLFSGGVGLLAYIAAWMIIPMEQVPEFRSAAHPVA